MRSTRTPDAKDSVELELPTSMPENQLAELRILLSGYITSSLKVSYMAKRLAAAFKHIHGYLQEGDIYTEKEIELVGKAVSEFESAQTIPKDVTLIIVDPESVLESIKNKTHPELKDLQEIIWKTFDGEQPTHKQMSEITYQNLIYFFGIIHNFYRSVNTSSLEENATELLRTFRWASLNYLELEILKMKLLKHELELPEEHRHALLHHFGVLMQRPLRIKMIFGELLAAGPKQGELRGHFKALDMKLVGYVERTQEYCRMGDRLNPDQKHRFYNNLSAMHRDVEADLAATLIFRKDKSRRRLPAITGSNVDSSEASHSEESQSSMLITFVETNIKQIMLLLQKIDINQDDLAHLTICFRQLEVGFPACAQTLLDENHNSVVANEYVVLQGKYKLLISDFLRFLRQRGYSIQDIKNLQQTANEIISDFEKRTAVTDDIKGSSSKRQPGDLTEKFEPVVKQLQTREKGKEKDTEKENKREENRGQPTQPDDAIKSMIPMKISSVALTSTVTPAHVQHCAMKDNDGWDSLIPEDIARTLPRKLLDADLNAAIYCGDNAEQKRAANGKEKGEPSEGTAWVGNDKRRRAQYRAQPLFESDTSSSTTKISERSNGLRILMGGSRKEQDQDAFELTEFARKKEDRRDETGPSENSSRTELSNEQLIEAGRKNIQRTLQKEFSTISEPGTYNPTAIAMITDAFLVGIENCLDRKNHLSMFMRFFYEDKMAASFKQLFTNNNDPLNKLTIAYALLNPQAGKQLQQDIIAEFQVFFGKEFTIDLLRKNIGTMIGSIVEDNQGNLREIDEVANNIVKSIACKKMPAEFTLSFNEFISCEPAKMIAG